jgi:hypothetical protein
VTWRCACVLPQACGVRHLARPGQLRHHGHGRSVGQSTVATTWFGGAQIRMSVMETAFPAYFRSERTLLAVWLSYTSFLVAVLVCSTRLWRWRR